MECSDSPGAKDTDTLLLLYLTESVIFGLFYRRLSKGCQHFLSTRERLRYSAMRSELGILVTASEVILFLSLEESFLSWHGQLCCQLTTIINPVPLYKAN